MHGNLLQKQLLVCLCYYCPSNTVTVITSVLQLLQEPHPDDALVASIGTCRLSLTSTAEQYLNDRDQYNKTAREYTSKYAASS